MTERVDEVFDLLDRWRHLPAYQLERRADIYFALYLREVLEAELGVELDPRLIPELPIRRDLVFPETPSKQSVKVDYAAFERGHGRVWFVELKTDAGSRRDAQDTYLERAKALGFRAIAEGLRDILQATNAPQKYFHLATAMADHGVFELPEGLETYVHPTPRRGLTRELQKIRVMSDAAIEVVYVQPHADGTKGLIDFATFARHVDQHDDPLSRRFARSLREWGTIDAGAVPPRGG